jgi:hypothetical protein
VSPRSVLGTRPSPPDVIPRRFCRGICFCLWAFAVALAGSPFLRTKSQSEGFAPLCHRLRPNPQRLSSRGRCRPRDLLSLFLRVPHPCEARVRPRFSAGTAGFQPALHLAPKSPQGSSQRNQETRHDSVTQSRASPKACRRRSSNRRST